MKDIRLAISLTPIKFGCLPSGRFILGFNATPSSKKGYKMYISLIVLDKLN